MFTSIDNDTHTGPVATLCDECDVLFH